MKIKKYLKETKQSKYRKHPGGFKRPRPTNYEFDKKEQQKYMIDLSNASQEIRQAIDKNNGYYMPSDKAFDMLMKAKELIRKATNQAMKDVVG